MEVELVDPRSVVWEEDWPQYRMVFRDEDFASSEWDVRAAIDVHEVLAWARGEARGRAVSVHVLVVSGHGPGLIRLVGPAAGAEDAGSGRSPSAV